MSDLGEAFPLARPRELPEGPGFELTILAEAAETLVLDLKMTFNPSLEVELFLDDDQLAICRFFDSNELSMALSPDVGDDIASTIVILAASVQDSDVFYNYFDPWPACPLHPIEHHSLVARNYDKEAWWTCLVSRTKVVRVGQLQPWGTG